MNGGPYTNISGRGHLNRLATFRSIQPQYDRWASRHRLGLHPSTLIIPTKSRNQARSWTTTHLSVRFPQTSSLPLANRHRTIVVRCGEREEETQWKPHWNNAECAGWPNMGSHLPHASLRHGERQSRHRQLCPAKRRHPNHPLRRDEQHRRYLNLAVARPHQANNNGPDQDYRPCSNGHTGRACLQRGPPTWGVCVRQAELNARPAMQPAWAT
jgi:hypothetical protein